ncbi:MAG: hypothetical protein HXY40_11360 [Chloroflexi bacterium]|nr:hypothetical protein [Chloroflexota bacterium]
MFKWIDRNERLLKLVRWLSTSLARNRGVPVLIGIGFVIVAFVLHILNVFSPSQPLELAGVILHYIGILTALIGLLLAEPLGK